MGITRKGRTGNEVQGDLQRILAAYRPSRRVCEQAIAIRSLKANGYWHDLGKEPMQTGGAYEVNIRCRVQDPSTTATTRPRPSSRDSINSYRITGAPDFKFKSPRACSLMRRLHQLGHGAVFTLQALGQPGNRKGLKECH